MLLCAGGSGVTVILSALEEIVSSIEQGKSTTKTIWCAWSVRQLEQLSWIEERLTDLLLAIKANEIDFQMFIHCSRAGTQPCDAPLVERYLKRFRCDHRDLLSKFGKARAATPQAPHACADGRFSASLQSRFDDSTERSSTWSWFGGRLLWSGQHHARLAQGLFRSGPQATRSSRWCDAALRDIRILRPTTCSLRGYGWCSSGRIIIVGPTRILTRCKHLVDASLDAAALSSFKCIRDAITLSFPYSSPCVGLARQGAPPWRSLPVLLCG